MLRNFAVKRDREDNRDFSYGATMDGGVLPDGMTHSLRPNDNIPIMDQLWLGSCSSNAILAFKEYIDHAFNNYQAGGYFHHLSRLFHYWHEREEEGTTDYDAGAMIRTGFKVLQKIGCCGESFFEYGDGTSFWKKPSEEAEDNAKDHKIDAYYRLLAPAQLRDSIVKGYPVVIGFEVYSNFLVVGSDGMLTMPDKSIHEFLGFHAVLAMGFKWINGVEYIECRNSYGPDWGDKGYFYMPMAFIGRYVSDMWTGR